MRQPLVAPCAALAIGIAVARSVSFSFTETLLSTIVLAVLAAVGFRYRARRAGQAACLFAFALVGAQRASLSAESTSGRVDQVFLQSGVKRDVPVRLRGWVRDPPEHFDDADRIVIEAEAIYEASPVWGGVRLTLNRYPDDPPLEIEYGEQIEVLARFREFRNFENPGSFDRVRFLNRQGLFISAVVRPRVPLHRLGNSRANSVAAYVWKARKRLSDRFDDIWGGTAPEPVLRALLLGDRTLLDRDTTTEFQRTGAYHALVISGLHIGLLAFVLLACLRLAMIPAAARALISMLLVGGYVVLLGGQLPVTRAAAMLAAVLVASLIFRRREALNVIAAVACCLLLIDPELLAEAGFQMSFAAVTLIAAIAVPLLDRTVEPYRRALIDIDNTDRDLHVDVAVAEKRVVLRNWIEPLQGLAPWPKTFTTMLVCAALRLACWATALALVSMVIQVGLTALMAFHFQRVSFSGIIANLLLMPLLTFVIPCGLLALATNWRFPAAAASFGAEWMTDGTSALAEHLHLDLRVPAPPGWLAALVALALVRWAWALRREKTLGRRHAIVAAALVAAVCLHPFPAQLDRGRLELTAIDVGQGESLFIAFPDGQTLLMDGGGQPDFGRDEDEQAESNDARTIDIGESVVSPYLWSRSIRRLDVVAVSHPDADHFGGIPAIIENFEVGELWLGENTFEAEYGPLVEQARSKGIEVVRVTKGNEREFGAAQVRVLRPEVGTESATERNNLSMVLSLHFREHQFLLTGDVEALAEIALGRELRDRHLDVLKVAHHGSRGSSSEIFLEQTRPMFAMISAGFDNTYRHPHEELLERLRRRKTAVLRTDLDGAISIFSDGHQLELRRFAKDR